MALQSRPQHAAAALTRLGGLVDDVWAAAGDKSADYNWYTKRALLAGVYGTTELYMLTGGLPGFCEGIARASLGLGTCHMGGG